MENLAPIQSIEKILILRPDGIGDVLNSTPAIAVLRNAYQNAHITALVKPPGAEILLFNPHVDEVLVYVDDLLETWLAKLRFLRQLRSRSYDLAVVLRNSSWCNFMAYFSGAQYRVGRKSERKMFSFTLTDGVRFRDPKGTKHEIDRNLDVVRLAGAEGEDRELNFYLSEDERAWARDFLRQQGIRTTRRSVVPLVGIHPGGSSFDKLWPAENFAQVANQLIRRFGAGVMLFGGPGEDDLVQDVLSPMIRPPICAVIPRLRQFAALVERCSLFLCNDSGPMHIAAALKVPTVAIFGPTDYVRWKPRNENAVIVRRDVDCWPCGAHKCERGFECIKSLQVSDVLEAGCSILDARY